MPNVTWQEPLVIVDLLALNLFADARDMSIPGVKLVTIISPWLTDVELAIRSSPWFEHLVGEPRGEGIPRMLTLASCVEAFAKRGWLTEVAVLQYGRSFGGIRKDRDKFRAETKLLERLLASGTKIYLVPNLHAKGVITPLGIITGSTNLTKSGIYVQGQNANYFAWNHPEHDSNRQQLLARYQYLDPVRSV